MDLPYEPTAENEIVIKYTDPIIQNPRKLIIKKLRDMEYQKIRKMRKQLNSESKGIRIKNYEISSKK
jgi:hypothetical protein